MKTTGSPKVRIKADSELMKNQKHAVIMGPQQRFEVLQTPHGDAMFFSIGSEGVFYVTRELRVSDSGWDRVELSSSLTSTGGKVKSFAVSQNPKTFDVAVIVSQDGNDSLYVSAGNSCSSDTWVHSISWSSMPFDAVDGQAPSPFVVSDMYMLTENTPKDPGRLTWFVDIVISPDSSFRRIERYFIDIKSSPKWNRHTLPNDVEEGSVTSCLGRRKGDVYAGIYTLGKIGASKSLVFTPTKNSWDKTAPPTTARLDFSSGTSAITSCSNKDGLTNLFVAADEGLYIFPPERQKDGAKGNLIIDSPPVCNTNTFRGATHISSRSTDSYTSVWALNSTADLVYSSCPAGSEMDPTSWSAPMQISSNVSQFAFYLNSNSPSNILFALIGDRVLTQSTQDPTTGSWTQRHILLPSTDNDTIFESNTFTTYVKCTDEYNSPVPQIVITIKSTQDASLSVNNVYRKVSPGSPLTVKTDETGGIVIIQETSSLPASYLTLECGEQTLTIDPQAKFAEKLASIKSGSDLRSVRFEDETGQSRPLVPSDVSSRDIDVAAKCLPKFLKAQSELPPDGSKAAKGKRSPDLTTVSGEVEIWGMTQTDNGLSFVEGESALVLASKLIGLVAYETFASHTTGLDLHSADVLSTAAGDFFRWLQGAWKDVTDFLVKPAEGVYQFIARIGGKIYSVILDCVSAVVEAIEFVFKKIKVFFEDLIKWLGFLFNWRDILRTHRVMKNVFTVYAKNAVGQIDVLKGRIDAGFDQIQSFVDGDSWRKMQDHGKPIGEYEKSDEMNMAGIDSPQSNWAVHHLSNGLSTASAPETATFGALASNNDGAMEKLLQVLKDAVKEEETILIKAIDGIRNDVFSNFHSKSPTEVIQGLLRILGTFLIGTAKNILLKLIDLIKIIISGILDLLDAPLNIPVISPIYKFITDGDELSALDAVCLIAAIPATLVCKLVTGDVPFPDNSETKALIEAKSFAEFSSLLSQPAAVSADEVAGAATNSITTKANLTTAKNVVAALKIGIVLVSTATIVVGVAKRTFKVRGLVINSLSMGLALVNASPTIAGHFVSIGKWTYVGDIILHLSLHRTALDCSGLLADDPMWGNYVSPIIGTTLGLAGLVTAIWEWAEKERFKTSDMIGFVGRLFSGSSGALTVATVTELVGPHTSVAAWTMTLIFTAHAGLCSAGSGGLVLGGN